MKLKTQIFISLGGGIGLGAGVAALSPLGNFWLGWLAASLLLVVSLFCLVWVWVRAGRSRGLGWMIGTAFLLHLGLSIALSLALPVYGYDNLYQKAGYPFKDSYNRDTNAWQLAVSEKPLLAAYSNEFYSDQYGGLLLLSAGVYRFLSPDAHRPFLILILASFATALGVPFLWKGLYRRWGKPIANLAAWIFILYPDGLFFSLSQMREPFIIGAAAIAFWAVLSFQRTRRPAIGALVGSLGVIGFMTWRSALVFVIVLAGWFFLDNLANFKFLQIKLARWAAVVLGIGLVIFVLVFSWRWFVDASRWDILTTQTEVGRFGYELGKIGTRWQIPFTIAYGLTQVVLPAALIEPGGVLAQGTAILRGAGWYTLIPILLYSAVVVWKVKPTSEKRTFLWLIGVVYAWIVLSSARAGGDMWDNPRYRIYLLPWIALLAAWTWQWVRVNRDAWFGRLVTIELIYLGFFTHWYLSRYITNWPRMLFWQVVIWVVILSGLVIFGGLVWDFWGSQIYHRLVPVVTPRRDRGKMDDEN